MSVRIHDAEGRGDVDWPDTEDGRYARAFLEPMLRDGVQAYVKNADTRLEVLRVDDLTLPLTVNTTEYDNSYVCSPYTHYVTYCLEELRIVGPLPGEALLRAGVGALGLGLRAGSINATVHVNNWLLSTNLYPRVGREQVRALTAALVARFPDHALVFRSVNPRQDPQLAAGLEDAGYRRVTSRRIYMLDPGAGRALTNSSYKRDRKLLRESDYAVTGPGELTEADLPRLVALYDALYLAKYSPMNPQFTERFLAQALRAETLTLRCLRDRATGRLDGVVGFFLRGGVMTTPLLGYDTSLPQAVGLYRMLNVVLLHEGRERGVRLHQSSGVGHFKRSRGAVGSLEYSAVFTGHLSARRRVAWGALGLMANRVGGPLLERLKL